MPKKPTQGTSSTAAHLPSRKPGATGDQHVAGSMAQAPLTLCRSNRRRSAGPFHAENTGHHCPLSYQPQNRALRYSTTRHQAHVSDVRKPVGHISSARLVLVNILQQTPIKPSSLACADGSCPIRSMPDQQAASGSGTLSGEALTATPKYCRSYGRAQPSSEARALVTIGAV